VFSTKEKAEEYILINKPLISLNDLLNKWSRNGGWEIQKIKESPLFNSFKDLAKSKL